MPPNKPDYNFITQNNQATKRRLSLPTLGLPKPVAIAGIGIVGVFLLIIIISLFSGGGKTAGLGSSIGRASEISRVSALVITASDDETTKSLATTAQVSLDSYISQIQTSYLKGKKIPASTLNFYKDKTNDTAVDTANQNNTLAAYYKSYLKSALVKYESDLETAYTSSTGSTKEIVKNAYSSALNISASL